MYSKNSNRNLKIAAIVGTRPNFMKLSAICNAISPSDNIQLIIIHTGQHNTDTMSDIFFRELNLPYPDYKINVNNNNSTWQIATNVLNLRLVLYRCRPDYVMVFGDVNSTVSGAIVSAYENIPVIHIESGLRCFRDDMHEELNRVITDRLSSLLFVTEESGMENLRKENINMNKAFLVGNTMVDTLYKYLKRIKEIAENDKHYNDYAMFTLHRHDNIENTVNLKNILNAVKTVSNNIRIVFPIHPHTLDCIKSHNLYGVIDNCNISILEPLGYLEFLSLLCNAKFVLTDSGGVPTESYVLGIPCLTLRNETEQPVLIEHGCNKLVGNTYDGIINGYNDITNKQYTNIPLWDGNTSKRIISIIKEKCMN